MMTDDNSFTILQDTDDNESSYFNYNEWVECLKPNMYMYVIPKGSIWYRSVIL